jgi:hypothetical protein
LLLAKPSSISRQTAAFQHFQGYFVGNRGKDGRDGFAVARVRRRAQTSAPLSLKEKLVEALRSRGPRDACFFAPEQAQAEAKWPAGGLPDLIIVSKGRAFGLELKNATGALTASERAAQLALRDAGMRIEVARSLGEALEHLREMGIVLKPREDAATMFGRRG